MPISHFSTLKHITLRHPLPSPQNSIINYLHTKLLYKLPNYIQNSFINYLHSKLQYELPAFKTPLNYLHTKLLYKLPSYKLLYKLITF